MQKVKVQRYVSGKRPEYAPASSSEEESEVDDFIEPNRNTVIRHRPGRRRSPSSASEDEVEVKQVDDRRLRRLNQAKSQTEPDEERHRFAK